MRSPSATPWHRRVDPWGPVLALVSVGVFLLHGYGGELTRDLSLYAYSGQQVLDGVPPYVSVLNRAGPLAHLVPAFGAWVASVLGTDDVLTMRVVMTVLSVISVWLIYVVGRDMFRSRLAGASSAVALLLCQGFVLYATGGPREKTTIVLLVLLALWAVTHRRWGLAGACVALATLTWQPSFVVGSAVAGVALLGLPARDLVRGVVRFCLAGLATAAVFVVGFALAGALDDFLECFLLINARYTDQTALLGYLRTDAADLAQGFGWTLWVLLAGLAACLAIAGARLTRLDRSDASHMAQVALGAGVALSTAWSLVMAFNGWADAMFVAPLSAVGLGGGVTLLARRLAGRRPALLRVGLPALLVVGLAAATWNAVRTSSDVLPQQREQIAAVLAAAPDDVSVASVGAPEPLTLGHLTNPVPYQMFLAGFTDYFDDTYPGGMQGISELIASKEPTLITSDHPSYYPWIQPMLTRDYTEIGFSTNLTWYARNDLGPDAIQRLRDAVLATQ